MPKRWCGKRGGYYDKSGALRDMFQTFIADTVSLIVMNHLLMQALSKLGRKSQALSHANLCAMRKPYTPIP